LDIGQMVLADTGFTVQTNGTQTMTLCKLPEREAVLFSGFHIRIMPFLKLHWPNGRDYPTQVKKGAFKMKVTPLMSSYIRMQKPVNKS
jgi:hypothetical protein